jgi:hypothetical protein
MKAWCVMRIPAYDPTAEPPRYACSAFADQPSPVSGERREVTCNQPDGTGATIDCGTVALCGPRVSVCGCTETACSFGDAKPWDSGYDPNAVGRIDFDMTLGEAGEVLSGTMIFGTSRIAVRLRRMD